MKVVEQVFLGWDGKTRKVNTYGICKDEKAAKLLVKKLIDETFPKEEWSCKRITPDIWKMTVKKTNPIGVREEQFICIKPAVIIDADMIKNSRPFKLKIQEENEFPLF